MEIQMENELLVTTYQNQFVTLQARGRKIIGIQAESCEEESILGNIYVGKVRNIVKNIHAAFVEFQKGRMGYLSLDKKGCFIHTEGMPYQEGRVCIGDEIIVQIEREAWGAKPPTLTGSLDLPGRYLVLLAGRQQICISSKIRQKEERTRLQDILNSCCNGGYGFIARTNSAGVSGEELVCEAQKLAAQYQKILDAGMHAMPFRCLHCSPSGYLCHVRDVDREKTDRIVTDNAEVYQKLKEYLDCEQPQDIEKLVFWKPEDGKLDAVYNISRTIKQLLVPKVWLKSGAYLVIQPTEALVSIDVNTGKAVSKKKDVQQTFRKVNAEAAKEIARQLQLRNLSGIILIDFIDMEEECDREELLAILREAVSSDPVRCHVVDMTALGLVEMTRKKVRRPLYQQLGVTGQVKPNTSQQAGGNDLASS